MLGTIKSIEKVADLKFYSKPNDPEFYVCVDGFKIKTEKHVFHVLINNEQDCCEYWGYFLSEDDHKQFLGARLYYIRVADIDRNTETVIKTRYRGENFDKETGTYTGYLGEDYSYGGIQFVDFVTSNGVFQLAVYNAHNGYYGHEIYIIKDKEILLEEVL